MIVRYARERVYSGSGEDPFLTIGRDYVSLGIVFRPVPYTTQVCLETDVDTGNHLDGNPVSTWKAIK